MSEVLNRVRGYGVLIEAILQSGSGQSVFKITLSAVTPEKLTAADLADTIKEGERIFQNGQETTVWLCIEDSPHRLTIPPVVLDALDLCRAYGVGLFVSQGDKCTHAPGQPIDVRVVRAVKLAHRDGAIQHPIAGVLVQG